MEDELEDKVFYQTYVSHMKILSKFAVGLPLNSSYFTYIWRIIRLYILKPEVILLSTLLIILIFYIQALEVWSRGLISKLKFNFGNSIPSKVRNVQYFSKFQSGDSDRLSWDLKNEAVAAYAIQGRRPRMEDRFVVEENIGGTEVSVYAVFDGHGGEFAANYAQDFLMENLKKKIAELKKYIANGGKPKTDTSEQSPFKGRSGSFKETTEANNNKGTVRKVVADDAKSGSGLSVTDPLLLEKLESFNRGVTRQPGKSGDSKPIGRDVGSYLDPETKKIDFGLLLTDQVLEADRLLVEAAKKALDVAGTTALIAVVEGTKLIVANVGDSRGVMCDSKGNAIPLSFDHKPQQMRERKRIRDAGGFITFNGVWRVAGILATSRALGDYPLKEKKLVIADPDILTFSLADHKPQFLILASDGLWDTFTNEEAVAFVKSHISEPFFGARAITLQAYNRGSLDNITVLIINLSNHNWGTPS